ncbi:MAG: histidinol phosphate phosphatase domain-containing protein [Euryarchaeota archaeon]|nr:histidinol phosphate phosphatase domain-containing protein [Euryarchaeota archaeon]
MKNLGLRVDFHVHSLFSDGELLPSEIARRALALDYGAVGIADHVDVSNLDLIVPRIVKVAEELNKHGEIEVIPGVEITHVPPKSIPKLAKYAKELGSKIVIVHGETIIEPVSKGTNLAAVKCTDVDILSHPGIIAISEAELARSNGIFFEITSRNGHCLTNGHVALTARAAKVDVVVNADAHAPEDLITQERAYQVAIGSGFTREEALKIIKNNPAKILKRI